MPHFAHNKLFETRSRSSTLLMATDPPKASDPLTTSGQDDQLSEADSAAIAAAMAEDSQPTAKSLKCVDCGKLFKNADLANYHAEKSGHGNFEESVEEVPPPNRPC